MRSALVAGGLLAFALSFDEIVVTTFTAGVGFKTLPLWFADNFAASERDPDGERRRDIRRHRVHHSGLARPTADEHDRDLHALTIASSKCCQVAVGASPGHG